MCWCPISISIVRTGIAFLDMANSVPISASTAEDITCFSVRALMRMMALFGGSSELLDSIQCSPA